MKVMKEYGKKAVGSQIVDDYEGLLEAVSYGNSQN